MPVTDEELGAEVEAHTKDRKRPDLNRCGFCFRTWPCLTHRLIEAHREALVLLEEADKFGWVGKGSLAAHQKLRAFLAPPQPEAQEVGSE